MKLEGVIVPLITPLRPDESLDEHGLERVVEYVIEGGVTGIFVLGSSGEFPNLDSRTKERLLRAVRAQIGNRVSLLAGISNAGTRQALEQGKRLARLGADAIVVTAPYYYPHTQSELATHFLTIARTLEVPLVAYNIPQMVKVSLEPETVARLAEDPFIIGIKDSAGDMAAFGRFLEIRNAHADNFSVSQGAEQVAAESVLRGADGVVLGLANIAPRLCRELYDAAKAGDREKAEVLQQRLMHLYPINEYKSFVAGLKTAASLLDLCKPIVTAPFEPLDDDQVEAVRQRLVDLNLLDRSIEGLH